MRSFSIIPLIASAVVAAGASTAATARAYSAGPVRGRFGELPVGCAATRAASTPIPFERVDLGPAGLPQTGDDLLLGPRMLVVISDSTTWPAIWRAAVVDTVPPPRVSFGRSVLVLVATRTEGLGPLRLRVTSIRQCRGTGLVVVATMQTYPRNNIGATIRSRGFDVVRVPDRALATNTVLFEDHFQIQPLER